ncbi:L-rhamnose-binding lectin SML-like [Etheostoma cragini]|uniref:L-rhamnose-binding lectin SML-like n=1 Tax=Etheostoma cragini TaxID=417921 RepID=UPI00155E26BF|nr:L-rhamnose-binding lectin SML-like [Etheostoma cragini]
MALWVLAATCVPLSPGVATETVTTCEVNTVHCLSCAGGVIGVQEALYGRADSVTCGDGRPQEQLSNTECSTRGTVDILKKWCDGKKACCVFKVCLLPLLLLMFNVIAVILTVYHVTSEHSLAYLQCDEGQVTTVYCADYGRHDQSTCTYIWPASEIHNADCSRFASTISSSTSCNGKNSCIIKASNSVFGDPCLITFKYLEVAYVCGYPSITPI